jgi:deazaflavin-dependent oxidoreductase (nitroreductase family)
MEPPWPLLNRVFAAHASLYKLSGGRIGHRIPFVPPMLLLDHVGAKSGTSRTTPLVYLQDGERMVIVASKGGHPRHPSWFHNLRANPGTTVQVGTRRIPVTARVADETERGRLWPRIVKLYGPYASYQRKTDRRIPLVVLDPR